MNKKMKLGILTGGGDCPGMNAVIRAIAKKALLEYDVEVIGIEDGYDGLINNRYRKLDFNNVSGIVTLGGTILGTSNKANPYSYAVKRGNELVREDVSAKTIANVQRLGLDYLVCIGGDGTLIIGHRLFKDGVPVVGVPKTIDNDVIGTDITFGFDSAVHVASEGIERIRTTAQSHHRVMIVEVMGRNAGWIALHAGIASGADIVLIPEITYDLNIIAEKIRMRHQKGRRYTIVVVAEGVKIKTDVDSIPASIRSDSIGFALRAQIEEVTGIETRAVVMGHLQRGGIPTAFDRVLATRLGIKAVDIISKGEIGYMAAVKGDSMGEVPLDIVAQGQRLIASDDPLIQVARSVGTCFGDQVCE